MIIDTNLDSKFKVESLFTSSKHGNFKSLFMCILRGDDVNVVVKDYHEKTPLYAATVKHHNACVKLLLKSGADFRKRICFNESLLHTAIINKNLECVKLLLDLGIDVNCSSRGKLYESIPINLAILAKDVEIFKLLLENGAFLNLKTKLDVTTLHFAVESNQNYFVEEILKRKVDVDVESSILCSMPISTAIINKNLECVKLLLEYGADVNFKNNSGKTPIWYASAYGSVDIFKLLVERGADLELKNKFDIKLIHVAALFDNINIVKHLIENDVDVNTKDNYGDTPLHYASIKGHLECVKLLLESGADPKIKNNEEETPLHMASKCGYLECINCLSK